ncbi:hypothetical protein Q1695_005131 [Nippostrongylus brasiliensis]|nr:hypothetical protein Q1695_005131 [Nippostrongylus brasiliensis]
MMANPYSCEVQLDELSPDHSIIDFAYISEENFALVVLLASNGDVQTYCEVAHDKPRRSLTHRQSLYQQYVEPMCVCLGPEATFAVFGLSDGNLLLTPIKTLMDVPWGSSRWLPEHTSILISLPNARTDDCLVTATCMKCFVTKNPPRPLLITANKAGTITLVDLSSRKCVAELCAPQSIHDVDVLQHGDCTNALLTSFTGAQWIIPLENNGRSITEVLSSCIPSEFRKVEPATTQLCSSTEGVTVLDTNGSSVELHSDLPSLASVPKKRFKVPPETWLIHYTESVLFAVSKQAEVRSAVHFGLSALRMEFSIVKGACEWRPLGFVPLSRRAARLPSCLLVNERGLIRIAQSSTSPLETVASEFLFRIPNFSLSSVQHVAKVCSIDATQLQRSVIPTLLSARRGKTLSSADLTRLLSMANTAEIGMEKLVDLFATYQQEEQLLPEILRVVEADGRSPLRKRVVELYVRRCEAIMKQSVQEGCQTSEALLATDHELSSFLSRHVDVDNGAKICAESQLWKSACLLAQRQRIEEAEVLRVLIRTGAKCWSTAVPSMRSLMMTCATSLEWSDVSEQEVGALVSLLCEWQAALNSIAYHETCLRLAMTYMPVFAKHCSILYLISALYIISDKAAWTQEYDAPARSVSCGINGSAAITADGQLLTWGDFTNQQSRSFESSELSVRSARKGSLESPNSPKRYRIQQLPHAVHVEGRPRVVSCGAEHILVLTSAGRLFSWGRNRFGQCGVGHSQPISEPQLVEGDWGAVRAVSAGQFHSAVLNTKGELWMFGWGVWGQLGMGRRFIADCTTPTKVPNLPEPIKEVGCGRVHTVLLTVSGRVLVAGGGSYGQLGTNEDVRKQYDFRPLPVDSKYKFVKIATCFYMSIAVTDDGRIFEWGRNPQEVKMRMFVTRRLRMAQLKRIADEEGEEGGIPNLEKPKIPLPMETPRDDLGLREVLHLLDGQVVDASAGLSHVAVVTDQGSLFTWGKALDYQLGHGNKTERSEPHILFDPRDVKWKLVACGGNHTIAVSRDGRTFGWGRNDYAQCGVQSDKTPSLTRKYFYQPPKDGAVKRCVSLPDDACYVIKPTLIPEVELRFIDEDSVSSSFDQKQLLARLRGCDLVTIQTVSRHFLPRSSDEASNVKPSGLDSSIPIAFVHLMAGNVLAAIEQIGRARIVADPKTDPALRSISGLAWEVVANHEDCQSRSILAAAFRNLPITNKQKRNSQLRRLWPMVWDEPGVQDALSPEEKLDILETWVAPTKNITSVEIPAAALKSVASNNVSRVRVWAKCSHVEPAVVGVAVSECSACAEEWADMVRTTLSSDTRQ